MQPRWRSKRRRCKGASHFPRRDLRGDCSAGMTSDSRHGAGSQLRPAVRRVAQLQMRDISRQNHEVAGLAIALVERMQCARCVPPGDEGLRTRPPEPRPPCREPPKGALPFCSRLACKKTMLDAIAAL